MPVVNEVKATTTTNGAGLVIEVKGFFNLDIFADFRHSFEAQDKIFRRYAINLQYCKGISSAGLGMLLMLREYSKLDKENLLIIHCPADVYNVLRYSNFDQLFTILT